MLEKAFHGQHGLLRENDNAFKTLQGTKPPGLIKKIYLMDQNTQLSTKLRKLIFW